MLFEPQIVASLLLVAMPGAPSGVLAMQLDESTYVTVTVVDPLALRCSSM